MALKPSCSFFQNSRRRPELVVIILAGCPATVSSSQTQESRGGSEIALRSVVRDT